MDVQTMWELRDDLQEYLSRYDDCFSHAANRRHLCTYVSGQLSDLDAKSVEPIALAANVPVRTLQEFVAQHGWETERVRARVSEIVRADHSGPRSIGIFDETSDVKKGRKTPGVQRQWCGKVGKTENCVVTVHLAYAHDDFHCLLDGELYLPQSWAEDRERCREAGIPDEMNYRSKWRIALECYDRACKQGLEFAWITGDEGYGSKPELMEELQQRKQNFVLEVPRNFSVWSRRPATTERSYRRGGRGRPRNVPRLKANQALPQSVEQLSEHHHVWSTWEKYRIKESDHGPMVWEARRTRVVLKGSDGLPGRSLWLVQARNGLDANEIKYFVSNGSDEEPMDTLLIVAFSRWRIERVFEDQKQEIGLDCYEGRKYLGLKRHLILSTISYLFLSKTRERLGGKKGGHHNSADSPCDQHYRPEPLGV